jgi:hypothetical protein
MKYIILIMRHENNNQSENPKNEEAGCKATLVIGESEVPCTISCKDGTLTVENLTEALLEALQKCQTNQKPINIREEQ